MSTIVPFFEPDRLTELISSKIAAKLPNTNVSAK
jgi:hypothetical protein